MRAKNVETGQRISAVLVGYAAFLLLVQSLGQRALDLVWAGLTAPIGWLLRVGNELLAATDAATGGPLFDLVLGLVVVGLAGVARLLIWPLTVESSATEPSRRAQHDTSSTAGRVVELPATESSRTDPAKHRRAA